MTAPFDFSIRRIITGHDARGQAIVEEDREIASRATFISEAAGNQYIHPVEIWGTAERPVSNADADLALQRGGPRELPESAKGRRTQFRIVALPPGSSSPMHRTETLDYAILLDGTCEMLLDGGEIVQCRAGDVVIQRGTIHSWINRGDRPCRWAWILIDADPVEVGGERLEDDWRQAPPLD